MDVCCYGWEGKVRRSLADYMVRSLEDGCLGFTSTHQSGRLCHSLIPTLSPVATLYRLVAR